MRYNLGALVDWLSIGQGEMAFFETIGAPRHVEFDVLADTNVAVFASYGDGDQAEGQEQLLAYGSGLMEIRCTASDSIGVFIVGPSTNVRMRTRHRPQLVSESAEASFTTAEPRRSAQSEELRRMLHAMRANMERNARLTAAAQVRPPAPVEPDPVVIETTGGGDAAE